MNNNKYLISIVVPVFNSEKYIENTLESIKNQTIGFENIEVVFVDDYSADNSREIIEKYSKDYENVSAILLDENTGFGGEPRNVGIKNATSEFIMFIDSDDVFYPTACETLYGEIKKNNVDLVSGHYVTNVNGVKTENKYSIVDKRLQVDTVYDNSDILAVPPAIMSKIYKKSVILENDITFPKGVPGEDLVFSTNYFLHAKGIIFIDFPVFEYVIRDSSVEKSVSYERSRKYLTGLTDSYLQLYDLIKNFDEKFLYTCLTRLNYWCEQFSESNLTVDERVELLKHASFLFEEFEKTDKLSPNPKYKSIFDNVLNRDYLKAAEISNTHRNSKILADGLGYIKKASAHVNAQLNMLHMLFDNCSSEELFKGIELIEKWNLFDSHYYCSKYNYDLDFNPLLHYLSAGYLQGRNPSEKFDTEFYKSSHINIIRSRLNPLLYFVLYGIDEGNVLINEDLYPYHKSVNRNKLNMDIENFTELGVKKNKRDKKLIVSLTSFPERLYDIHYCLYSLLTQDLKPDEVVLWLASQQFPNGEADIPDNVLDFKKNGLKIMWCDDIKSYKKLIPALKAFPDDLIVTADDDLYYPSDWLRELYDNYKKYPDSIISQRSRKISFNPDGSLGDYDDWELSQKGLDASLLNFPTNGAGSLFSPNSLYSDVSDESLFKKLCPNADDIWIWAMAVLNRTKIKCVDNNMASLTYVNLARELNILNEETLYSSNVDGGNDLQIKNVLKHYPKIMEILREEL